MTEVMDWNHLRTFLAIARNGKLTVAARRLRLTHSTLSRHAASLESALNMQLFDRTLTGYVLTPQGTDLMRYAEEVEAAILRIHSEAEAEGESVSGTVRVGLPDGLGADFLGPKIGELTRQHPGLCIEIVATPRSFSLSRREADIVLCLSCPENGRVHARKLTDYELGLYVSAAHFEEWVDVRAPADLSDRPFIGYIDDLIFAPELDYLPQVADGLSPAIRSSNIFVQKNATIAGAGACVIPCFLAEGDQRLARLLPEEVRLFRSIWMAVQSDIHRLPRIATVTSFIASLARSHRGFFLPGGGAV
jgi:Transcriptional regulator